VQIAGERYVAVAELVEHSGRRSCEGARDPESRSGRSGCCDRYRLQKRSAGNLAGGGHSVPIIALTHSACVARVDSEVDGGATLLFRYSRTTSFNELCAKRSRGQRQGEHGQGKDCQPAAHARNLGHSPTWGWRKLLISSRMAQISQPVHK